MKGLLESLESLAEARKPKVTDVLSFKHKGKVVRARLKDSKWMGGDKMSYTWKTEGGVEIKTIGLPKGYKVVK